MPTPIEFWVLMGALYTCTLKIEFKTRTFDMLDWASRTLEALTSYIPIIVNNLIYADYNMRVTI